MDKQVDKQVDNDWIMAGFMGFDDIPCLWWRFVMIGYKLACRSSTFLRGLFRAFVCLHFLHCCSLNFLHFLHYCSLNFLPFLHYCSLNFLHFLHYCSLNFLHQVKGKVWDRKLPKPKCYAEFGEMISSPQIGLQIGLQIGPQGPHYCSLNSPQLREQ